MAASGESDAPSRLFSGCWGCRVVCGAGLLGAGGYVFACARRVMQRGGPTGPGTVSQIVFALALAAWGAVILVDPVSKSHPK